jgi:formylglycine-generating enzyme required for sulfatase activity
MGSSCLAVRRQQDGVLGKPCDQPKEPEDGEVNKSVAAPAQCTSWYDAVAFCNGLSRRLHLPEAYKKSNGSYQLQPGRKGFRLPTEAEWEYAARAGTRTSWHFGNDLSQLTRYAWYDGNTNKERAYPVAQRLPNQWGLFDMLGNVWEWTLDRRQNYPASETFTNDVEDSVLRVSNDNARTRRGGSYAYEWFTTRSAHRGDITYFPNQTRDNVGFRVARTMPSR